MEERQGIWERFDAAIRAGTGRVRRVTGLLIALLGLTAAVTLLWSAVTGVTQRRIALQPPLGPALVISDLSDGSETDEQTADWSAGEEGQAEKAAASPGVEQLEPLLSQQVTSVFSPLSIGGGGGGMCFFGEFGGVKIYPPGRRRYR